MKAKGFIGRLAAVAVVLCLITMSLTSGTLAKYASETTGNATATVAKWDVKFENGENTFDTSTNITLKPDATSVSDGLVVDNKIAPEIKGSLALTVDGATTDVAFDYSIILKPGKAHKGDDTTTEAKAPVKFYKEAACTTELEKDSDGNYVLKGTITKKTGETQTVTATVYWKWDSTDVGTATSENERDTALGTAAETFKIPVTVKAVQRTEAVPASGGGST